MNKLVATVAALTTCTLTAVGYADDAPTLVISTPNAPVVIVTGTSPPSTGPAAPVSPPPAAAAASAAPAAQAAQAPMTNDWRDVSHINGQAVPVGERDAYLLAHRHVNLAFDPLTLLVGWIDVEAQVAVSDSVAISASFATLTVDDTTGMGAALTAPIFFRKVFSGPYLEPGVVAYRFSDADGVEVSAGPQLSIGWQWMYDSGFNVALAAGTAAIGGDEVVPQGYLRTGYAF